MDSISDFQIFRSSHKTDEFDSDRSETNPIVSGARQDKTRQDKTRQDKTRQDKTRQDKTRQDNTRQDRIRHGGIEQDGTGTLLKSGQLSHNESMK
jgi:hypothetical protein